MNRLFISHSTMDREELFPFVEFLRLGMGISPGAIFCTSASGTLPAGQPFIDHIRGALQDCRQVLCFLTPNYLRSKFCLAELGAAWLQQGKVIPLLVSPLRFDDLRDTPLAGLQALRREEKVDLMQLYDELCRAGIAAAGQTVEFNRQLEKYQNLLKSRQSQLLTPDEAGYYRARIEAVRPVPHDYRCYKLSGLAQLEVPPLPGESHWLFFRAGMYEDLHPGDAVQFSVSSSELRDFPDLKCARNLYPGELRKLTR